MNTIKQLPKNANKIYLTPKKNSSLYDVSYSVQKNKARYTLHSNIIYSLALDFGLNYLKQIHSHLENQ